MPENMKKSPAPLAGGNRADIASARLSNLKDDSATDPSPQTKWNLANPKALWAHQSLRSAIRRGLIERKPCEVCGAEPADGHHHDYNKPLAVTWLCRAHHQQHHQAEKKTEDGEA